MITLQEMIQTAQADNEKWFPDFADDTFYHAACLAGEVGEVLNLLKKVVRGTHHEHEIAEDLNGEVADAFTYLLSLCAAAGIDLEAEYFKKRQFNGKRYNNAT